MCGHDSVPLQNLAGSKKCCLVGYLKASPLLCCKLKASRQTFHTLSLASVYLADKALNECFLGTWMDGWVEEWMDI